MTCKTFRQLLDGTDDWAPALGHRATCPECQADEAAAELALVAFGALPFSEQCPEPEQLATLMQPSTEGLTDTARLLWRHVLQCPECTRALATGRRALAAHGSSAPLTSTEQALADKVWQAATKRKRLLSYLEKLGELPDLRSGWPDNDVRLDSEPTREELESELKDVFDEAEQRVRSALGPEVFERWALGKIQAERQRVALRPAAASGDGVYQLTNQTSPHYLLQIRQKRAGSFTDIRCLSTDSPPVHWAFRLAFDPVDEQKALLAKNIEPKHLGALRLLGQLQGSRFVSLVDLLLPHRFGSNHPGVEATFAAPMQQGGVVGALPGEPTGFALSIEEPGATRES